jgi:hypothetical protein
VNCPASVASDLSGEFGPLEGRMRRTEQLQGLRMLKLRETLTRWEAEHLSQLEAAEILGMSERTLRRWARRLRSCLAGGAVCSGRTCRCPGQHGVVERTAVANPGASVTAAFCPGRGQGA